jgi:hypothetical protein
MCIRLRRAESLRTPESVCSATICADKVHRFSQTMTQAGIVEAVVSVIVPVIGVSNMDTKNRVFVYYNFHKKCWSVKALSGKNKGRVVQHRKNIFLKDCTFRVSESSRQRVIRENKKNVHAGVVGEIISWPAFEEYFKHDCIAHPFVTVNYNPKKHKTFVESDNKNKPIHKAAFVHLEAGLANLIKVPFRQVTAFKVRTQ